MRHRKLANDIMQTKLVTLAADAHVFDGIARLLKLNLTGAPVIARQHQYLGVFSEKCCMRVLMATAQAAGEGPTRTPCARDVMITNLVTLRPDMDAFDAIGLLLKRRISGAPVIDEEGSFLGVFSEKTSMSVLLAAACDQLPTCRISAFIDSDRKRTIGEEKDLLSIAQMFVDTPYRRLPVLRGDKLVGQISRRDVLRAAHSVSHSIPSREEALSNQHAEEDFEFPSGKNQVATFMDTTAKTIGEELDLLGIAQVFRQTPYRRLPVLKDGRLLGQVSRRDLLQAIYDLMSVSPARQNALLYLSSLVDPHEAPL